MLIAKENSERIPPMPEGMYEAVCTMLIDMGVQNNPRFGTSSRKIRLVWEVLGQTVKIGDQEYPRQIFKEFTNRICSNLLFRLLKTATDMLNQAGQCQARFNSTETCAPNYSSAGIALTAHAR